jgi:hypothetical protein
MLLLGVQQVAVRATRTSAAVHFRVDPTTGLSVQDCRHNRALGSRHRVCGNAADALSL